MTNEEKEARREERQRILREWKEEKQQQRALRRQRRKARPLWRKILSVAARVCGVAVILGLVFVLCGGIGIVQDIFISQYKELYFTAGYQDADIEEVRALYPADEEAQAAIAAMPGYEPDDTWAIYMYVVGSNLESQGQNDLSDMVAQLAGFEREDNEYDAVEKRLNNLALYTDTIAAEGLELPGPMYYADPPEEASSVPMSTDVVLAEGDGAVFMDMNEIRAVELPANIEVVIQTGGSTHWTDNRINPNRIQRFVYSGSSLIEEESMPTACMGSADALADFLRFCEENHDADHKVLLLWDHGGGAFGYGLDEIFGRMMSIGEIGEALGAVYEADAAAPAFEMIGFDACLMASAEVMDMLDGYGRYFAGSEELEPGMGWYYTDILEALAADPGMNGAQLALAAADAYMDFYARMSINMEPLPPAGGYTFSVLDIHRAAQAYAAYEELAGAVLSRACEEPGAITAMSRAAHRAIHYGMDYHYLYNTIDLGTFMDGMPAEFANEVAAVRAALDEAVLYTRSDPVMAGSQGLSVYFPDSVTKRGSVSYLMDYIDNVTDSDALRALYFYKAAGCLTEDMRAAMEENGAGTLRNLDLNALETVSRAPLTVSEDGNYAAAVSAQAAALMQNIGLALFLEDGNEIVCYGTDNEAHRDGGRFSTDFDGSWPAIDGALLALEIISDTETTVTYSSDILLDGEKATLVFFYDKETQEFTIGGAYKQADAYEGDFTGRNISEITKGSKITPVYKVTDSGTLDQSTREGKSIRYGTGTAITLEPIPDGSYLSCITFTSTRGDEYSTRVVELTMNGGAVSEAHASDRYSTIEGN